MVGKVLYFITVIDYQQDNNSKGFYNKVATIITHVTLIIRIKCISKTVWFNLGVVI